MILITDSNLIISALITPNGAIASIIKAKHNFQFIAPDFVFEEIDEHWDKIKVLSLLSDKELKAELLFYRNLIKNSKNTYTKKDYKSIYRFANLPIWRFANLLIN